MKHFLLILGTMLMCLAGAQSAKAATGENQGDEIYAVLSSNGQTLTLYYTGNRSSNGGVTDWSIYNNAAGWQNI